MSAHDTFFGQDVVHNNVEQRLPVRVRRTEGQEEESGNSASFLCRISHTGIFLQSGCAKRSRLLGGLIF